MKLQEEKQLNPFKNEMKLHEMTKQLNTLTKQVTMKMPKNRAGTNPRDTHDHDEPLLVEEY